MSVIVTTSWDDGHKLDNRLAELLDRYGFKGTFYISKDYLGENRLSESGIKNLAVNHEIGAHTLRHVDLTSLTEREIVREITASKEWLESVVNRQIEMFCYPKGIYSAMVAKEVESAGFIGARTTKTYTREINDVFAVGTTINVHPFPLRKIDKKRYYCRYLLSPFLREYKNARDFGVPLKAFSSWTNMAKSLFDEICKNGGVFHLWGHSWEIEKYDMWDDVEEILGYISQRNDCIYLTNGEMVNTISNQ